MSVSEQDRPHPASPQRLQRAREEGDFAHSNELAIAIQMIAGVGAIWFCAGSIGNGLRQITTGLWSQRSISADSQSIIDTGSALLLSTMQLLLPFLICIFVVGSMAHLAQTKFLFNRPKLQLRAVYGRQWFESLCSFSTAGQIVMASPKIIISLGVAAAVIWSDRNAYLALGQIPVLMLPSALVNLTAKVGISVALSLFACSIFDYFANRFSYQRRMKMTDQEVREELRGQTGDPQVAKIRHQRIREIMRDRIG